MASGSSPPLVRVRLLCPSIRECTFKYSKQNFVESLLRQFRTHHLDVNWPLGALLLGNLIINVSPIMAAGSSPSTLSLYQGIYSS
jgi:hypothetical protein